MTGSDLRAWLDRLGWSPEEGARQLGIHRATMFRWLERGCDRIGMLACAELEHRRANRLS